MGGKLPISAMVVGYNEGVLLNQCFQSIEFCDEIFYTDLGSTDNSKSIAAKFTDNILERDRAHVPSCEMVQAEVVHLLKNDWVLFIDPDEKVDAALADEIQKVFYSISVSKEIGAVMVPWQFYFKKHSLKGTVWGGKNKKYFIVNRQRFSFLPIIHYGRKLNAGFVTKELGDTNKLQVLHHYWMNSYKVFFRKHFRYLKNEALDQFNFGRRVGKKAALLMPFKSFWESFWLRKGYLDGVTGFFLSLFWAFYTSKIAWGIVRLQHSK